MEQLKHINSKIIGVAGGSGSGKTSFARLLAQELGEDQVLIISQDSYYIDRSREFLGDGSLNFDHPEAIDWILMAKQLSDLESGLEIQMPVYDFASHSRKNEAVTTQPKRHIIVDGILIYVPDAVRDIFDLRIFIDTREPIRFERRMKRDLEERGRTSEGVRAQYQSTVLPMHNQFVEPTKDFAHYIADGESDFNLQVRTLAEKIKSVHQSP